MSALLERPVSARRKPVNLSLNEQLVARARRITPNLSGTVEALLTQFVQEADAKRRADDALLDQVIAALNAHHEEHGFLSEKFNDFIQI